MERPRLPLLFLALSLVFQLCAATEIEEGVVATAESEAGWFQTHIPIFMHGARIHHTFPGMPVSIKRLLDDMGPHPRPFHPFHFHFPLKPVKIKHDNGDDDDDDDGGGKKHKHQGMSADKLGDSLGPIPPEDSVPADSCVFSLQGESFDLSMLKLPAGTPVYAAEDASHTIVYKLNICGIVTTGGSDCMNKDGMVCQYSTDHMDKLSSVIARWGKSPTPNWEWIDDSNKNAGVKLVLNNGDKCFRDGKNSPRKTSLYFSCDSSAGPIGNIAVQEVETCHYVFTIPTQYGCLGAASMSSGWIFIIMFILGVTLYIGGGCAYNRYRFGWKGMDAFPNRDFWQELPSLVKDGIDFTSAKVREFMDKRRAANANAAEEEAVFGDEHCDAASSNGGANDRCDASTGGGSGVASSAAGAQCAGAGLGFARLPLDCEVGQRGSLPPELVECLLAAGVTEPLERYGTTAAGLCFPASVGVARTPGGISTEEAQIREARRLNRRMQQKMLVNVATLRRVRALCEAHHLPREAFREGIADHKPTGYTPAHIHFMAEEVLRCRIEVYAIGRDRRSCRRTCTRYQFGNGADIIRIYHRAEDGFGHFEALVPVCPAASLGSAPFSGGGGAAAGYEEG